MSAPVVDFHARLGPGTDSLDQLLAAMDEEGVGQVVASSGGVIGLDRLATQLVEGGHITDDAHNEAVLAAAKRSGGRVLPFFFANPHGDPGAYREQAAEFCGLEISPAVHGVRLDDPRTVTLVEAAAEVGHPVYVVCLARQGCGARELVGLAERFPEVSFVLGHCGFTGIDLYSLNQVAPVPNILGETSGCYTVVAQAAVERLGADRVLFGTEYPLQHPSVELAKIRALRLDEPDERRVLGENACRLLGVDAP